MTTLPGDHLKTMALRQIAKELRARNILSLLYASREIPGIDLTQEQRQALIQEFLHSLTPPQ